MDLNISEKQTPVFLLVWQVKWQNYCCVTPPHNFLPNYWQYFTAVQHQRFTLVRKLLQVESSFDAATFPVFLHIFLLRMGENLTASQQGYLGKCSWSTEDQVDTNTMNPHHGYTATMLHPGIKKQNKLHDPSDDLTENPLKIWARPCKEDWNKESLLSADYYGIYCQSNWTFALIPASYTLRV